MKMSIIKGLLLILAVVVCATVTVQADDFVDVSDGLWSNPANWVDGTVPTSLDWAKISNASNSLQTATIGAGVNATSSKTHLGYTGGGVINIIDGGTLTTVGDDLLLAKNGGNGTLNLYDGAISVGKDLEVGQGSGVTGTLNMYAGTITVGDDFEIAQIAGTTGIVNLDGGTITLNGSGSQFNMYAGGSLNFGGLGNGSVSDGLLVIIGKDLTGAIGDDVAAGWITSDLGYVTVETVGADTHVYGNVIPEPATLGLLGLTGGAMVFMRRRFNR